MPAVLLKSKNTEENTKNKFQLTELQKEYLQLLLPQSMGLRLTDLTDEKRSRTPKKTEQIYDTQFFNEGNRHNGNPHSSHPKNDKKISTKEKEKINDKSVSQKNRKNSDSMIEIRKKTDPKKRKPKKEIIILNSNQEVEKDVEKDLVHPKRNIQSKRKEKPIDTKSLEPIVDVEKNIKNNNQNSQIQPHIIQSSVSENKNLSIKQEKIQKKRKDKQKQQTKNEICHHQQNQSHSFAPAISKQDHSGSNEGHRNTSIRSRLVNKQSIHQQVSKRENMMSMNSIHHISENSDDHNKNDTRQLSPSSKLFCRKFLNKMKHHKSSWPFRIPVDPVTQGVPNYLQIVHRPMDIKTIQKKLNANQYQHVAQFHADINKIFLNSYKFNPRETNYFTLTIELQAFYYYLLENVQANPSFLDVEQPAKAKSHKVEQDFTEQTPLKKKKTTLNAKKAGKICKNQSMKEKDSEEFNKESQMESQSKQNNIQNKDIVDQNHRSIPKSLVQVQNVEQNMVQKDNQKKMFQGISTPKKLPRIQNNQKSSHKKKFVREESEIVHKNFDFPLKEQKKLFSHQQKRNLAQRIRKLSPQYLQNVLNIIYGEEYVSNCNYEQDFNIQLNDLSEEILKKLEMYVKQKELFKADEPTCLDKYFVSDERLFLFDPFPGTF